MLCTAGAPAGLNFFSTNEAIKHAKLGQDCAREPGTGCDKSVSRVERVEAAIFDFILAGQCHHGVLSLRSAFSIQILTQMQMVHAQPSNKHHALPPPPGEPAPGPAAAPAGPGGVQGARRVRPTSRPVSVVNLDHGRTSTTKRSFVLDKVGQKHCAQEYEDR